MKKQPFSADAIRQTLLERAAAHSKRFNVSLSHISQESLKDGKFLAEVAKGRNFTIKSYQTVMDWIDAAERETAA